MEPLTAEEKKAIASLKRLAKRWPETLFLFGGDGGTLAVLKLKPDGSQAMTPEGSIDQEYLVAEVQLPNDGGGW